VINKEIDYLEKPCHLPNETQNIVNGFTALVRPLVAGYILQFSIAREKKKSFTILSSCWKGEGDCTIEPLSTSL
jgi:hypothetical protein